MTAAEAWTSAVADLWPGSRVEPGGPAADRTYLFLPNAAAPRMLLTAGRPRAAASALRRYSHDLGPRQRGVRALTALAMSTGLPERALRDRLQVTRGGASIEDRLAELLGTEVVVSITLGNERANRKPVLHALTPAGRQVAFVKVGDNDPVRSLIADEARALARLSRAGLSRLRVPEVLHHGVWQGLDLLVLSPLSNTALGWRRRSVLPLAAMRELAETGGPVRRPVAGSPFLERIERTCGTLRDRANAERLANAAARLTGLHGDTVLEFAAWHGDWTPWNMAWRRDVAMVWDWERYATDVPFGFDLLHYRLQVARNSHRETPPAEALLAPLGISGAAAAATLDLYLLALCARYLEGSDGAYGEAIADHARNLLDRLEGVRR